MAASHLDVVQKVHDDLIAAGVVLDGSPATQFEQTKRVAWALRGENYGLLRKTRAQTNYHGYAIDAIVDGAGNITDILRSDGASAVAGGRTHQERHVGYRSRSTRTVLSPDGYLDAPCRPQPLDPVKNPEPDARAGSRLHHPDDPRGVCGACRICRVTMSTRTSRRTFPTSRTWRSGSQKVLDRADYWGVYWWDRIQKLDRSEDSGRGGPGPGGVEQGGGANGALVNAQLGLLEDDIVYRLALLAVNVLEPLKGAYPNIVVVSGFRQVNSGIGQHELGEAVDIQIRNQTPEQLYEVADYIKKRLNFDTLILNWTEVGDGQGWIHVSFSPNVLRGQVMTKDFADAFHDGLFLCTPLSGEAKAAALRQQATDDAALVAELKNLQARQLRLSPSGSNEAVPDDLSTGGGNNTGTPAGPGDGSGTNPDNGNI
jgi:hypothetical protein